MITSCTHCGAQYQLPDKLLGKQARCKACKRMFVIVPAENPVELPAPTGSTASMAPVEEDDELDGLASAAAQSSAGFAPVRNTASPPPQYGRHRTAQGAQTAMAMGIIACVFAIAGVILMAIAIANDDNQNLLVTLGIITLGILSAGAICAMIAVMNGSAASKKIRRARHPLAGQGPASAGTLTGAIALTLILVCAVIIGVYLGQRGGIKFQKHNIVPKDAAITQPSDPTT